MSRGHATSNHAVGYRGVGSFPFIPFLVSPTSHNDLIDFDTTLPVGFRLKIQHLHPSIVLTHFPILDFIEHELSSMQAAV